MAPTNQRMSWVPVSQPLMRTSVNSDTVPVSSSTTSRKPQPMMGTPIPSTLSRWRSTACGSRRVAEVVGAGKVCEAEGGTANE